MNPPLSSHLTTLPSQPLLTSCPLTPSSSHCSEERLHKLKGGGSYWQQQTCFRPNSLGIYIQGRSLFSSSNEHHKICTLVLFPLFVCHGKYFVLFTCRCKAENKRHHCAPIILPLAEKILFNCAKNPLWPLESTVLECSVYGFPYGSDTRPLFERL